MTKSRSVLALAVFLVISCRAATAESVIEVWRSAGGVPRSVAVNTTDGSAWAATGSSVMHFTSTGETLGQVNGFGSPLSVSVNTADSTCWVADTVKNQVVHLESRGYDEAGVEIIKRVWRGSGFKQPASVSVNSTDGSCWVADTYNNQVVHLSSAGVELWRGGSFNWPGAVSVNSSDGSCWVADTHNNQVVHLSSAGAELWRGGGFNLPQSVSVNPSDGSCWVADTYNNQVVHLSSAGTQLSRSSTFRTVWSVSANSTDGSCWAAYWGRRDGSVYVDGGAAHLASDGTLLWRGGNYGQPYCISANSGDRTCWVTDTGNNKVVHLQDIRELWRGGGFTYPRAVGAADNDTCWVADTQVGRVLVISANGTELAVMEGQFTRPASLSVNPTDDSCWVGDWGLWNGNRYVGSKVAHLTRSDTTLVALSENYDFNEVTSVSVNSSDGSCWVADYGNNEVVHLSANGDELWRGGGFSCPVSVSVNSDDNSCWVAVAGTKEVVHLDENGTELWRGGTFAYPSAVSVNSSDATCWVADYGEWDGSSYINSGVVHLAANGTQLWRSDAFDRPYSVSANSTDGSCWVADTYNQRIVRLLGDAVQPVLGFNQPSSVSVNPGDGSCWVADMYDESGNRGEVVHVSGPATKIGEAGSLLGTSHRPWCIAVDYTSNAIWMAFKGVWNDSVYLDGGGWTFWDTAATGIEFCSPPSLSVAAANGAGWLAETYENRVLHLDPSAVEQPIGGAWGFDTPSSVSADPLDDSCWVADSQYNRVIHLDTNGNQLSRTVGFNWPLSVAVSNFDQSCWVADTYNNQVVHVGINGQVEWRGGGFSEPVSVATNSKDGSCWVADTKHNQVVHLDINGNQLWRGGGFNSPQCVAVNSVDNSCWVADTYNNEVVHLSEAGEELWRGGGFNLPQYVALNPATGAIWVADTYNDQIVRLGIHAPTFSFFASPQIVPSGGRTGLYATYVDPLGYDNPGWSCSDGGAGGSFYYIGQDTDDPTLYYFYYTAPVNPTASDLNLTLTIVATSVAQDNYRLLAQDTVSVSPAPPALTVNPTALQFSAVAGGANPPGQSIAIGNLVAAPLNWTATVTTSSGGRWLAVSPASGTAPSQPVVSVNVSGLAVGTYSGQISVRGQAGTLYSPQTVKVTLTIRAPSATPGTLKGQVVDKATGAVLEGATVGAYQADTLVACATAGKWGVYVLDNLAPGSYQVIASNPGYTAQTKGPATVAANATTYVNFGLQRTPALKGQIIDKLRRTALVGATVNVYQAGTLITSGTTGAYGVYSISNLAAGTYVVQAVMTGYGTQSKKDIEVIADTTTFVNFSLIPQ